jgi:hypothetical protein
VPASVFPPVAPEAPLRPAFVPEALAPVAADPEVPEKVPAAPVAPGVPAVAPPLVVPEPPVALVVSVPEDASVDDEGAGSALEQAAASSIAMGRANGPLAGRDSG